LDRTLQRALALVVGCVTGFLLSASAATMFSEANDCEVQFTLGTPPYAITDLTTGGLLSGTAGSTGKERCPVLPFQLPDLGAVANPFLTASFTFNYTSKNSTVLGNVDVYGLGRRVSPTVQTNDYWTATAALDPTDATFLEDNIITANSTDYGLKTTANQAALVAYLNAQYAAGAGAGQYVFLRLSTDTPQTGGANRYNLTSAEGSAGDASIWPQINYTTVPLGDPVDTIRVETRADGSGIVVPATNIVAGTSLTNYAIVRNAGDGFVTNTPAAWVLTNVTGSVAPTNLVAAPDGRSAVFTPGDAGSAQILAVGNATNLVSSGVITVFAAPNPFNRPCIWVRDSEKAGILAKIATSAWAQSVYNAMMARVAADVVSHQSNRDSFLRQLPIDWTQSPPVFKSIPTYAESTVRGPTEGKFNDGVDCAVLYYLTGDEKYARCGADILHNAIKGLIPLPPSTSVGNGGWLFQTDFLKEARVTGSQLAIIYDFLYPYLQTHQVYDVANAGMVNFDFAAGQQVFRTFYLLARDHGQLGSNWSALMSTCMLNSILALDDATERAAALQVYLVNSSSRQASLDYDYRFYVAPGDIWPESLQYASGVGNIRASHMVLLERYDPSLSLFDAYPNLPLSLSRISYLRYPNGEQISFGDGHRYTDGQPYFRYELMYQHAKSRGYTNLTAHLGSLINGGVAAGEHNRAALEGYESLGMHDEPLQLLWFAPTIPEAPAPLVLPRTDTLPFAGIALQRNPVANSNSTYGLMGFVGGASHVHSHASGMSMEIYGLGQVMGAKSGRTGYGDTDNENHYRLFAANNTIIVNGASRGEGGWGGFGINTVQVVAMEPKSFASPVSSNVSFTCSSFADNKGTLAEATQQRTLAIIRTSSTSGYYVDIFRSKSTVNNRIATTLTGNVTNQFHDYIHRNIGDRTVDIKSNGVALPMFSQASRFQNDIGDANEQPGWRYFTNTVVSYPHNQSVRAQFKATPTGKPSIYMDMHLPAVTMREVAKVDSPAIVDAPAPYDAANDLSPTLVVRQIGEAWDRPFAVVYEPHYNLTGGTVQNVTTLLRGNVVVGVKVESTVGGKSLVQYVISNPNANETYADAGLDLSFTGRFAVITENSSGLSELYLGEGSSLSYGSYGVASVGGTNTQASVIFSAGQAPVVTANAPVNVTTPIISVPAFTRIERLSNGIVLLTATGAINAPYQLWSSTNLSTQTWNLLGSGTVQSSPFTIQDPGAISHSVRYYRFSTP